MNREEALAKVVKNIRIIDGLHNLADAVYDVREREGLGWDGPEVVAYGKAVSELKASLLVVGE